MIPIEIERTFAILEPRFRRGFAYLTIIGVIAAIWESVGLSLIFIFIHLIAEPGTFADRAVIGNILKHPALPQPPALYVLLATGIGCFYVLKNVFLAYAQYIRLRYLNDVSASIANRLFAHYLGAPYEAMVSRNSSELVQNVSSLAYEISGSVLEPLTNIIAEDLTIAALVVVLLLAEPTVTAATAFSLGGLTLLVYVLFRRRFARWGKVVVDLNQRTIQAVQESISSLKEIQILDRRDYFCDRFAAVVGDLTRIRRTSQFASALPRFMTEAMMIAAMVLVIAIVVAQGRSVESAVALLGLYAAAGFRLVPSLNRILMHMNNLKAAKAIVDRVFPDIMAASSRPDRLKAASPAACGYDGTIREIALDNVTYRYPTDPRPALEGVTLAIRKGESIGLVGASGAGKSTLADVLLGLLPPTGGRILINGAPISPGRLALGGIVGYVPQAVALIDSSLRRNIALGVPDADIDDEALSRSIALAALEDVVSALPQGMETVIGERGARLSGGQRQRIGIARSLYHDPQLIVFDEATSALDSETERAVTDAIERLKSRLMTLTIAHRLSTVRRCDRIVFMKDGKVTDTGGFADLVGRNADFARMVRFAELTGLRVDEAVP